MKKLIIIVLVCIVHFVYLFLKIFVVRASKSIPKNSHILIINNAKIGDMVCSTPVYREIKKVYPDSSLTLMLNPKASGVIKNNPNIDNRISIEGESFFKILNLLKQLRRKKFDASVVLVPGTINYLIPFFLNIPIRSVPTAHEYGWFYRILAFLTSTDKKVFYPNTLSVKYYLDLLIPIGIKSNNLKKEVYCTQSSLDKAKKFLEVNGCDFKTPIVGISPTAGNKIKEWPVSRFIELGEMIYRKYGYNIVVVGSPADSSIIENIIEQFKESNVKAIPVTNFLLEDLPDLISLFKYFVSVDTGTLYIANALDIPVLDIAGPCNIYDQIPIYEKCEVVYVPNLPGWPYTSVLKTVTQLTDEQMLSIYGISSQMVMDGFDRLVKKYGSK